MAPFICVSRLETEHQRNTRNLAPWETGSQYLYYKVFFKEEEEITLHFSNALFRSLEICSVFNLIASVSKRTFFSNFSVDSVRRLTANSCSWDAGPVVAIEPLATACVSATEMTDKG